MMWQNRFRVHPIRWSMAILLVPFALYNSAMHRIQQLFYGRKIANTNIEKPPVFIIGHWRSGTTFLHELMSLDERFAFPSTYECVSPYHFLVTGWIIPKMFWFILPSKRPMDNMQIGFDKPQEDEFALCAMGAPTSYYRMGFPNNEPQYHEFLEMADVNEQDLSQFREALMHFVKTLTYKKKKQLILKSPPHTGRIQLLSKMFPGARFVHIFRNPYSIFASTRRLWQTMDVVQGFQIPKHDDLDEYIFDCFERMYRGFHRQRQNINPAHICDVRYEDLVQDPIGEVQAVYEKLGLGDFDDVREKIEAHVADRRDYKPNKHELDAGIKSQIAERWSDYLERYGYEVET